MSDRESFPESFRDQELIPVLITRQLTQNQLKLARELGLKPTCISVLHFDYPEQWEVIHTNLSKFNPDVLAFTSKHGVEGYRRYSLDFPVSSSGKEVYAVGPSTAEKLFTIGLNAHVPELHNAASLARFIINKMKIGKVAWFCGNRRRDEFENLLSDAGFDVLPVVAYHTQANPEIVDVGRYRALVFYSPSAVMAFLEEHDTPDLPVFAIGPTTASALKDTGFSEIIESSDTKTEALLQTIADYYSIANGVNNRDK